MDACIEFVPPEKTYSLRHEILRAGLPLETCYFPGDAHKDSVHLSVVGNGDILGVMSLYHEDEAGTFGRSVWRIRGMAVKSGYQGQGIGGQLMERAHAYVKERGGQKIWCNARSPAVRFYQHHGFQTVGDEFDIPTAGPHFVMEKKL